VSLALLVGKLRTWKQPLPIVQAGILLPFSRYNHRLFHFRPVHPSAH
jgi:hypothetical protein